MRCRLLVYVDPPPIPSAVIVRWCNGSLHPAGDILLLYDSTLFSSWLVTDISHWQPHPVCSTGSSANFGILLVKGAGAACLVFRQHCLAPFPLDVWPLFATAPSPLSILPGVPFADLCPITLLGFSHFGRFGLCRCLVKTLPPTPLSACCWVCFFCFNNHPLAVISCLCLLCLRFSPGGFLLVSWCAWGSCWSWRSFGSPSLAAFATGPRPALFCWQIPLSSVKNASENCCLVNWKNVNWRHILISESEIWTKDWDEIKLIERSKGRKCWC